jgi:hypothetical protein
MDLLLRWQANLANAKKADDRAYICCAFDTADPLMPILVFAFHVFRQAHPETP